MSTTTGLEAEVAEQVALRGARGRHQQPVAAEQHHVRAGLLRHRQERGKSDGSSTSGGYR